MVSRLVLAAVVLAVAAGAAARLRRRRPDPPFRDAAPVPAQLDRHDFDRPDAPWLVVLFSSASCESCGDAAAKVRALQSPDVAVQEVEWGAAPELHRRYAVEAVPIVVVVDAAGVTRASFRGSPPASDLGGALAALRDPGDSGVR